MQCVICGQEFTSKRKNRKTCGSVLCQGELSRRRTRAWREKQKLCPNPNKEKRQGEKQRGVKKENPRRPFTFNTDMLLVIDMQKGWPLEKVAKVAAQCFDRDYNHVLEHIKKLKGSNREKQILKILRTYRLNSVKVGY